MKGPIYITAIVLLVCYGFVAVQDSPVKRDQFIGKWTVVDYEVHGATDPYLREMDSTAYWFHSDGTFTFSMTSYPHDSDSTRVDGKWTYDVKNNLLVLDWDQKMRGKKWKWNVKFVDETNLVLFLRKSEIWFYQKSH